MAQQKTLEFIPVLQFSRCESRKRYHVRLMSFELLSEMQPQGDQAQAIAKLTRSLEAGNRHQTLLGVTGSGKTFTAANIIRNLGRPTLIISHNKTLAAQLYSEFKQFFPNNAVEYFVSYFDFYQPEAYIPRTDTFIEKDSSVNEEIERLRLATTSSLLTRKDVIVIASVSCIYGMVSPEDFLEMLLTVKVGMVITREHLLMRLVDMLYERNDIEFGRGRFRVRGDVIEVQPGSEEDFAIRIEMFGDEIERISRFHPLTGQILGRDLVISLFPAKQFVTPLDKMRVAMTHIRAELDERVKTFETQGKLLEAQRIRMRTEYDLDSMQEMGFCSGIENYSRHLSGRPPGSRPYTLLDFFPRDFLLVVDESHVTVPQIGAMYEGDRVRKTTLVEHGFRLPSALDNRPLNFSEFMEMCGQALYITATPADFEVRNSVVGNSTYVPNPPKNAREPGERPQPRVSRADDPPDAFDVTTEGAPLIAEQIIRPTGLLDPVVTVRPLTGQIDETIALCRTRVERSERVLVTTLTKRTAEELTEYLKDVGLKVRYLHSDIDAIERVEILRALRAAEFDILVGINLLREGLDLPEVSLVCILDADKEGYLRSQTSLVQTAGRAARHVNGEVFLFADTMTQSIRGFLAVTAYRRDRQMAYNKRHGITPTGVKRAIQESLHTIQSGAEGPTGNGLDDGSISLVEMIRQLETEMAEAAAGLEFERAAILRDQINELRAASGAGSKGPQPDADAVRRGGRRTAARGSLKKR